MYTKKQAGSVYFEQSIIRTNLSKFDISIKSHECHQMSRTLLVTMAEEKEDIFYFA